MYVTESLLRSAVASKLAYSKNNNALTISPHLKHISTNTDNMRIISCKKGTHAYIWKTNENSRLISFRGSTKMDDIYKYMNTKLVPFNFCEHRVSVHNIILDMFMDIEGLLYDDIFGDTPETLYSSPRSLTFCGHSLGGALAKFSAAYFGNILNTNVGDMSRIKTDWVDMNDIRSDNICPIETYKINNKKIIRCHTFGAPKVGDKAFVRWHKKYVHESLNLVTKMDLVPIFPHHFDDVDRINISNMYNLSTNNIIHDHNLDTYINFLLNTIQLQSTPGKRYINRN